MIPDSHTMKPTRFFTDPKTGLERGRRHQNHSACNRLREKYNNAPCITLTLHFVYLCLHYARNNMSTHVSNATNGAMRLEKVPHEGLFYFNKVIHIAPLL